jgi:hypothetical protein
VWYESKSAKNDRETTKRTFLSPLPVAEKLEETMINWRKRPSSYEHGCRSLKYLMIISVDTLVLEPNAIHSGFSLVLLFPSKDS